MVLLVGEEARNTSVEEIEFFVRRPGVLPHGASKEVSRETLPGHGPLLIHKPNRCKRHVNLGTRVAKPAVVSASATTMDEAQSELLASLHAFTILHGSEKGKYRTFKTELACGLTPKS